PRSAVQVGEERSAYRTTEKEDVAVGVLELETAQPVISVFKWVGEFDIARNKFGRQCVTIWNINVCLPAAIPFWTSRTAGERVLLAAEQRSGCVKSPTMLRAANGSFAQPRAAFTRPRTRRAEA